MILIDQPESAKISATQIESLEKRGFSVLDPFLDSRTIGQIILAIESLEADPEATRLRRGVAFARRNLLELGFVRALVDLPRVRQLRDAISPSLVPMRAILFDKNESANWTVPWHQDRSIAVRERIDIPGFGPWSKKSGVVHVQPPIDILQQMLTLRFHLDPCSSENGPLRVITGTHRRILNEKEVENAVVNDKQIACTCNGGGLLIMRPLILHASSPARAPSHRRVIHIEFGPPSLPNGLRWAIS